MKKAILLLAALLSFNIHAAETITILNPSGPSHSGTPHIIALMDRANANQKKYIFVQEFKAGGYESIALKAMLAQPSSHLTMITNTTSEAIDRGFVRFNDLVPVFSMGDSCWGVIVLVDTKTNDLSSVKKLDELLVGTPALGGATHLAALEIGKKYNVPVRMVPFRSNYEGLTNMAANNGVNFVIERIVNYEQLRDKNPNLKLLAMQCPTRHPSYPDVKTLSEYNINSPAIFQYVLASSSMGINKRKEITSILEQAEKDIGFNKIFELSDQIPPVFSNTTTQQHYNNRWDSLIKYRNKWRDVFWKP